MSFLSSILKFAIAREYRINCYCADASVEPKRNIYYEQDIERNCYFSSRISNMVQNIDRMVAKWTYVEKHV